LPPHGPQEGDPAMPGLLISGPSRCRGGHYSGIAARTAARAAWHRYVGPRVSENLFPWPGRGERAGARLNSKRVGATLKKVHGQRFVDVVPDRPALAGRPMMLIKMTLRDVSGRDRRTGGWSPGALGCALTP
jgi:hypothetical protein